MAIFIGEQTRLVVQGITGRDGSFHTRQMIEYGTRVVAGVTPGKGGLTFDGTVPVYNTVAEAVVEQEANASVIYVPARFAGDAILEAADAGIELIVCITEGIPVAEMMRVMPFVQERGARLIGPNCPGLIVPGVCKVGILPGQIVLPGRIGIVSRSGTLTYEIIFQLTSAGIGQSTSIGIGGDPIIGTDFRGLPPGLRGRRRNRRGRDHRGNRRHGRADGGQPRQGGDEQAGRRLHRGTDSPPGPSHGTRGRDHLRIRGYGRREGPGVPGERHLGRRATRRDRRRAARCAVTKEGPDARTLGDLLSERRIILPLRAETLTQALEVLASTAVADGLADRDRLDQELETLADHDLIPIGSHAVMAHMRTEAAHDLAMMMGVAEGALPFAPATAPEARTLVLLIAPLSGGSRYLQTMAALARALGRRRVEERLDSAGTAAEVMELDALREPVLGAEILVRDVMTRSFVSVRSDAPMAEVAEVLIRRRLRAIPVVGDDGEVIGMVTDADIMEMFLPRIRGEEGVGSEEEDPWSRRGRPRGALGTRRHAAERLLRARG